MITQKQFVNPTSHNLCGEISEYSCTQYRHIHNTGTELTD